MTPKFSILIPFHTDHSVRQILFDWNLARWQAWFPEAEIIVGDDDSGSPLLNRSLMRNNAAKQATTDTFLFVDADAMIFSPHEFYAVMDLLKTPNTGMVQYQSVTWIDRNKTVEILEHDPGEIFQIVETPSNPDYILWGLFFAMTRDTFEKVNGFDCRFKNWGGEDPSAGIAIETLVGPIKRCPYTFHHLWHPRGAEQDRNAAPFIANQQRENYYRSIKGNVPAMLELIAANRDL